MLFMSAQHVVAMNDILDRSPEVRTACAQLPGPRTVGYRLADGPDGTTVHWSMTFDETVRFALDGREADVVFVGDWATMVRSAQAQREGRAVDAAVSVEGDAAVLTEVGAAFAAAAAVAVLPVEFPALCTCDGSPGVPCCGANGPRGQAAGSAVDAAGER
jgi:hypothetical protein